jgi:CRP/FNR family cyclic AMP-dependent transcriptional regulator
MRGSLRDVAIFKGLTEAERARIEQSCGWRTWEREGSILQIQEETRDVYFLTSGKARVIIYGPDGKPVAFRDIGPGDMFGEFAAIDEGPRSASVEALQTCVVACLPGAEFRRTLDAHPIVMKAVLMHVIAQMRILTARIVEYSTLAVKPRIWAELLRLAKNGVADGSVVTIYPVPTHAEIASRISTHREGVAREFTRLTEKGLIERRGHRIVVKDIDRLTRMLEDAADD